MSADAYKRAAAEAAIAMIKPKLRNDSVVGVGTGSTANAFIDALAPLRGHFDAAVASSEASAARLRGHGVTVIDLNAANEVLVYVDGADMLWPDWRHFCFITPTSSSSPLSWKPNTATTPSSNRPSQISRTKPWRTSPPATSTPTAPGPCRRPGEHCRAGPNRPDSPARPSAPPARCAAGSWASPAA